MPRVRKQRSLPYYGTGCEPDLSSARLSLTTLASDSVGVPLYSGRWQRERFRLCQINRHWLFRVSQIKDGIARDHLSVGQGALRIDFAQPESQHVGFVIQNNMVDYPDLGAAFGLKLASAQVTNERERPGLGNILRSRNDF